VPGEGISTRLGVPWRERRLRRRLAVPAALALLAGLAGGSPARAFTPLQPRVAPTYWSGAFAVDPAGPLRALSCPSRSLCVGYDALGNVVWSANPNGGAGVWQQAPVAEAAEAGLGQISCSGTPLCVAAGLGRILVSNNPEGGSKAWQVNTIDTGRQLTGVSCVEPRLCVAIDDQGRVLSSTEPAREPPVWTALDVDGATPLTAISCASAAECVAFDAAGRVLTSSEPTGGASAWTIAPLGAPASHVSCVPGLCVASDAAGVFTSTDPLGGAGTWRFAPVTGADGGVSCAAPTLCVGIPAGSNQGLTSSSDPAGGAGAWGAGAGVGARALNAVSCASVSLCVVSEGSAVFLGTATSQLSVALEGGGRGEVLSSPVSCPWSTCVRTPQPPVTLEAASSSFLVCEDILFTGAPGPECAFAFPPGNNVTLSARPAAGSLFAGWGGDCTGGGDCRVGMDTARNVTAAFVPQAQPAAKLLQAGAGVPRLSALRETNRVFAVAPTSTPASARTARRAARGTTFAFTLDQHAIVTIRITAAARGRRVGHSCRADTRTLRGRPLCTRTATVASLIRSAHSGANRVGFSGRLAGRALRARAYRAVFTAADAAGSSSPQALGFRIVRG
jgi:hypothetical protein